MAKINRRKPRAAALKAEGTHITKKAPRHRWDRLSDSYDHCLKCGSTRAAGSGRESESCPGRPPDLRGQLYKVDGLMTALARVVGALVHQPEPIGDLSLEGHRAVAEEAWPAVCLVEQLQRMLEEAGQMADEFEERLRPR